MRRGGFRNSAGLFETQQGQEDAALSLSSVSGTDCIKEEDIVTVTLPSGLWTTVLKPVDWHFGYCHLVFLEPEVTICG